MPLFHNDEFGIKKDAKLHEEMLKPHEESWSGSQAQERAIRFAVDHLGLSLEDAKRVYA